MNVVPRVERDRYDAHLLQAQIDLVVILVLTPDQARPDNFRLVNVLEIVVIAQDIERS